MCLPSGWGYSASKHRMRCGESSFPALDVIGGDRDRPEIAHDWQELMADNSLRYRTSPVLSRSRPSGAEEALGAEYPAASQPAGSGFEDPLAELARLVGEADPFPAESYATSRHSG